MGCTLALIELVRTLCGIVVYLRAVGGEVGATSSLAPKIGPLGLVCFLKLKLRPKITIGNFYAYSFLVSQEGR